MKQMLDQIFCSHKHNIDSSSDSVLNIPDIVLDSCTIVVITCSETALPLFKMLAEMDKGETQSQFLWIASNSFTVWI